MKSAKQEPITMTCEICGEINRFLNVYEDGTLGCDDCHKMLIRAAAVEEMDND